MKKITLFFALFGFIALAQAQNPFESNTLFSASTTGCAGDGNGNCDPEGTGLSASGDVIITLGSNANEIVISDVTGGFYAEIYDGSGNPATIIVDDSDQTLSFTNQPDTVFGDDEFSGSGTYEVDGDGNVTSFEFSWSNNWGDDAQSDFVLSGAVDCETDIPFAEDFSSANEFSACYTVIDEDGNGTAWIQQELELSALNTITFATNGTNEGTKEDYLFSSSFDFVQGQTYTINFSYNGADTADSQANESLEVIVADDNTVAAANNGTSLFTENGIVQDGDFDNIENNATQESVEYTASSSGEHYIVFKSFGSPQLGAPTTGFLLLFEYDVDVVLSNDEFNADNFKHFVNNNVLNIQSSALLNEIEIFNVAGKRVITDKLNGNSEAQVNLNALNQGVYIAKLETEIGVHTFKFAK